MLLLSHFVLVYCKLLCEINYVKNKFSYFSTEITVGSIFLYSNYGLLKKNYLLFYIFCCSPSLTLEI